MPERRRSPARKKLKKRLLTQGWKKKLQETVEKVMERMETDFDARQDEMADEICAKILGM